MTSSLIFTAEFGIDEISGIAHRICDALNEYPFVVWLEGDLGAGKTTLVGAILREFGLAGHVPVTSPTFTYINDYEIAGKLIGHLDLYRIPNNQTLEDLGILDQHTFDGLFVEWPSVLNPVPSPLRPTHVISLVHAPMGRRVTLTLSLPNHRGPKYATEP